jgi:hypothetical protein
MQALCFFRNKNSFPQFTPTRHFEPKRKGVPFVGVPQANTARPKSIVSNGELRADHHLPINCDFAEAFLR